MNRRTFLGGLAAIGIQGSLMNLNASPLPNLEDPKKQKKPSGRIDESLVILISDMHVLAGSHTPGRLTRVVNDVLAMKPLPANVVGLGDLANLYGHVEDYECAREILKPLEDAGIKVTLGMGNHDRRGNFARVFPEKAAQTHLQGRMDENLVVLISDMHVLAGSQTPGRLTRVVNDILAMKPLPANVVGLGDLANLYGHVEDYECAREILKSLEDAGIKVTLGMGNHDRRGNFALIFPEKAAQTRLQGRMVFIVETPRADIIVLDSLQEDPDQGKWITPGAINEEQAQWLRNTLKGYSKPVFVSAHHPEDETKVLPILRECPTCCGYIYGHEHHWHTGWPVFQWGKRDLMRTMCLPSTGYWGDIGYAVLNLGEDQATATLHQSDFFFNYPLKEGEEMPLQWSLMVKDNDGQKCSFSYRRPE